MIWHRTLTDGGQRPADIAQILAAFLAEARERMDIAIYDFSLSSAVETPIHEAITAARSRGVSVRIAYNIDRTDRVPVPPPARTDPEQLAALDVPVKGILGVPHLMHHKYAIVDGASVFTGSSNWTDDSWSREENVLLTLRSSDVAASFTKDFEELWASGAIDGTGDFDAPETTVDGARVRVWFSPGNGSNIAHRIAHAIARARRRVRVASPVITSGPILGTLCEVAAGGRVDLSGVYDATQMREVNQQWRALPAGTWKIPAFASLIERAPFSGKRSTPYAPGSVHDYMHAKVTVADDVTFVGSYNLSHAGEMNAETVLEIADAGFAQEMAHFVDAIRLRYATPGPRDTARASSSER